MTEPRMFRVAVETGLSRGLARLARSDLAAMGLGAGDTVQVRGARAAYGRVIATDRAPGTVGLDAHLSGNSGRSEGDAVAIAPHPLPPLDSLRLRGAGPPPPQADLADALFDMPIGTGDTLRIARRLGAPATFHVDETQPSDAGLFGPQTVVSVTAEATPARYADIGGLAAQIARVEDMIAVPLTRPDLYDAVGLQAPRGVLFTGPPGTGKTLLARAVAERSLAAFHHLNAPEIMSRHYGDSEAALRRVFEAAAKRAPAIIFIDEIDAIAPRRAALSEDRQVERRVVAQLLTLLDGLADRGRVVVMAATNLPDSLDPALRRPGRLDREIAFRPPASAERAEILRVHLARAPLADGADVDAIAERAHGYVGADLAALAREAATSAVNRSVAEAGGADGVDAAGLAVTHADLEHGLAVTAPSGLRGAGAEAAPVRWSAIGGAEDLRDRLERAILLPRRFPSERRALGIATSRGVLLTGPPGCGKTLIVRALATESGLNMVAVRGGHLLSQFLGEAERAVADLFRRARDAAPTLLFFDELDTLAPRRTGRDRAAERLVAELLVELDGVAEQADIVVLGATNRASAIDPALLRPGRFDDVIAIPMPGADARAAILRVHLDGRSTAGDIDMRALAESTEGLNGADIAALVRRAAETALARAAATGGPAAIAQDDLAAAVRGHHAACAERARDHLFPRPEDAAR